MVTRTIQLPDGTTATYDNVPENVTTRELYARARKDYPDAFGENVGLLSDTLRSIQGGMVRGIRGALDVPRQAAGGALMWALNKLGLKEQADYLARGYNAQDEAIEKIAQALGANYRPGNQNTKYIGAMAQGAASALSPQKWPLALGVVTGVGTQAVDDLGLGPAASVGVAFGTPLAAALTRRYIFPGQGGEPVAAALGVTEGPFGYKRSSLRKAKASLQAAQGVVQRAASEGVTLTPAQAIQQPFAQKHPLVGLQESVALSERGAARLQPLLAQQAKEADALFDRIINTAKESGKYTKDLADAKSLYELARKDPVNQSIRQAAVKALKGSRFYETAGTDQRRYLDNLIEMINRQDVLKIPATTTIVAPEMRKLLPGGKKVTVPEKKVTIPEQRIDVPITTQGQLLDVRMQAEKGFDTAREVGKAVRAVARDKLNYMRNPKVIVADSLYGPASEKEKLVGLLEEAKRKAYSTGQPDAAAARAAFSVYGHPASAQREAWNAQVAATPFESKETPARIADMLDIAARTGYGRRTAGDIIPSTYGEAKASGPSVAASATGLSGGRSVLLSFVPAIRQRYIEREARILADALTDPSGKKLMALLLYHPDKELMYNFLRTATIGNAQREGPPEE